MIMLLILWIDMTRWLLIADTRFSIVIYALRIGMRVSPATSTRYSTHSGALLRPNCVCYAAMASGAGARGSAVRRVVEGQRQEVPQLQGRHTEE